MVEGVCVALRNDATGGGQWGHFHEGSGGPCVVPQVGG